MHIEGKRVIVTGGSSGIGAAAVRVSSGKVHWLRLSMCKTRRARVWFRQQMRRGPGQGIYVHRDVSRRAEVQTAFERAVGALGGLDALVHVAGVG